MPDRKCDHCNVLQAVILVHQGGRVTRAYCWPCFDDRRTLSAADTTPLDHAGELDGQLSLLASD